MTSSTKLIDSRVNRRFRRLTLNTVIVLYFLIMVGGVVRSTGAGMGCPDWPKCFGSWIPPTEASQLPLNYKEIYGAKLKGEVIFNPVKTWIEYVNRLCGAATGVLIFITLLASTPYLKSNRKSFFRYSLLAFLLVGFQGWLGSKVVSSELHPVMITLHMLLAIVIVFILIYLFIRSSYSAEKDGKEIKNKSVIDKITILVLSLSLIQILLGTQVRETMDEVIRSLGYSERAEWIAALGIPFYVHRSFSILVLVSNVFWINKINHSIEGESRIKQMGKGCLAILGLEILTGIVMAYFGVPPFAQPVHLTLAIIMIGLQFMMWLLMNANQLSWSNDIVKLSKDLV
ncbi:heme A synthase [Dyadobacter subterraneus]|uniref:COX15/CtaA family protein n=1 Tax=Dyadobacter subterraneus TaxID=2773304 RepID=A0ABR9WJM7_9BACT|nr:COX15/CtaA family protein [Dyadobacter subterraneus]MBE9465588.1 COX15/CtaA family protein [Dyadobacter subterraneus]